MQGFKGGYEIIIIIYARVIIIW